MKVKPFLFFLLVFISFSVSIFSSKDAGVILEYEISGKAVGGTEILGNLKVILKENKKRLTGNMFYEEPGSPYPTLDEKDMIVDFASNKKYLFTTESESWANYLLKDDFSMIKDNEISVKTTTGSSEISAVINVSLPQEFGGKRKYTIKFMYESVDTEKDKKLFTFNYPTAFDFLSIYLDNEKIIDLLNKKLSSYYFKVPKEFTLVAEQNGKVFFSIKGNLRAKFSMSLPKSTFNME